MDVILTYLHAAVAAIVSDHCADVLVRDMDVTDADCLKRSLSKVLGYAVVLGAVIVKVPQIINIVKGKSAEGVSLMATLQELVTYSITLSRSYRRQLPFSTWGESLFITVQLVVLVVLIMAYNKQTLFMVPVMLAVGAMFYALLSPELVNEELHTTLQGVTVPIMVMSRLTQIITVVRNKATGKLSGITSFLNAIGAAARVFTTLQEVKDMVILASFLTSTVLNFGVLSLFFIYPRQAAAAKEKKNK